ncbi:hypothetical protein DY000_02017368 [Brassica cretica]|uniref:Uncharacterized protein n=1 Tax=Brassica cretica TaxID=69181 RepID=A0ABQ7CZT0_BRACR|nr:hypothetical protein DY000_02017368 [Brassica cretica]
MTPRTLNPQISQILKLLTLFSFHHDFSSISSSPHPNQPPKPSIHIGKVNPKPKRRTLNPLSKIFSCVESQGFHHLFSLISTLLQAPLHINQFNSPIFAIKEDKQKYGTLGATLDQLAASVLDGPLQKRKPQLTKTQEYPYVGNSTVKRIIKGDVSKAYYDPLAKVVETKFKKLLDYLRSLDGDNDVDTLLYEANNAKKCVGNISFWVAVRF